MKAPDGMFRVEAWTRMVDSANRVRVFHAGQLVPIGEAEDLGLSRGFGDKRPGDAPRRPRGASAPSGRR